MLISPFTTYQHTLDPLAITETKLMLRTLFGIPFITPTIWIQQTEVVNKFLHQSVSSHLKYLQNLCRLVRLLFPSFESPTQGSIAEKSNGRMVNCQDNQKKVCHKKRCRLFNDFSRLTILHPVRRTTPFRNCVLRIVYTYNLKNYAKGQYIHSSTKMQNPKRNWKQEIRSYSL